MALGSSWAPLLSSSSSVSSRVSLLSLYWALGAHLRRFLGSSWACLGLSWAPLGSSWPSLGRFWAHLGRLWALLGSSWASLGRTMAPHGHLSSVLIVLGSS